MNNYALAALLVLGVGCSRTEGAGEPVAAAPLAGQAAPGGSAPGRAVDEPASAPGKFVEGEDYLELERVMFLDSMGFDQPVEAFSVLFPRGWKTEGGVRWLRVDACRGEMVSLWVKGTSPDGAIQFELAPVRSFGWSDDAIMMRGMQAAAAQGGCQLNQPFSAQEYVEGYARMDLGATASDIRPDTTHEAEARRRDADAMAMARRFGNDTTQATSAAYGSLSWPDGSEGISHVGVINVVTRRPNMVSGGVVTFSNTQVFYNVVMRFPPARRAEATRLMGTIVASQRINPVWQQAKDKYMMELGNAEHAARMEQIRLFGEQRAAYARARSADMDRQMRGWERQQSAQDASVKRFVQTIREVETWNDGAGSVELNAGYEHAWSRGDGRYILSNSPNFDPNAVFLDPRWEPMRRPR